MWLRPKPTHLASVRRPASRATASRLRSVRHVHWWTSFDLLSASLLPWSAAGSMRCCCRGWKPFCSSRQFQQRLPFANLALRPRGQGFSSSSLAGHLAASTRLPAWQRACRLYSIRCPPIPTDWQRLKRVSRNQARVNQRLLHQLWPNQVRPSRVRLNRGRHFSDPAARRCAAGQASRTARPRSAGPRVPEH